MCGMNNYRIWLAIVAGVALGFLVGRMWPGPSDLKGRYRVIYDQTNAMSDDEREAIIAALRQDWATQRESGRIIKKYADEMRGE
jgi:hypothetical protein